MNKTISILLTILILLSGLHFSIATHFCGGKVAAVKWSFSAEKATCGMENTNQKCPAHKGISSNCCQNKVSSFIIDNNYKPTSTQNNNVTSCSLKEFKLPVNTPFQSLIAFELINNNNIPPGILFTSALSLTKICVYRI